MDDTVIVVVTVDAVELVVALKAGVVVVGTIVGAVTVKKSLFENSHTLLKSKFNRSEAEW